MSVQPRMLDHPFYQAWTRGEVSRETLAAYHRSYADFIQQIPSYWQRVVNAFQPDHPLGTSIVQEEREHILLWALWGRSFTRPDDLPSMQEVLRAFDEFTPSRLLGALQAFEVQQPEVARAKKDALLHCYGLREDALQYFDAHELEEKHIAYGHWLAKNFADRNEFEEGYVRGAELVYRSLDGFVTH